MLAVFVINGLSYPGLCAAAAALPYNDANILAYHN